MRTDLYFKFMHNIFTFSTRLYILFDKKIVNCIFLVVSCVSLSGCYSFTGGSTPEHLKSMYIATVTDKSGFGIAIYREVLTQQIQQRFRNDNSFTLLNRNADADLTTSIVSIVDVTQAVQPGELEKERRITISTEVEYYDSVKKKLIWKKTISNYDVYQIANTQVARNEAILRCLDRITDDIFLAVISGW